MKTKFKKGDIVKMVALHDEVDAGNTGIVLENHVYPLIKWDKKSSHHPELHPTLEGYLKLVTSRRWITTRKILMVIPYFLLWIFSLHEYSIKPDKWYLAWKEYWLDKGYGRGSSK